MPIVQISKLQHRSGADSDLPQLDIGELGYATDSQRLYIGDDHTVANVVSEHNNTYSTEILTEHSNISAENLIGTLTIAVGDIKITGGSSGRVLSTNGSGVLSWVPQSGGAGGGTVSGSDTEIQFNTAGGFDASGNLTFNKTSKTLTVDNIIVANVGATGNVSGLYVKGNGSALTSITGANVTGFVANANVANLAYRVAGANVTGSVALASLANSVAGANVTGVVANALVAGTVLTGAQPNITSVGTLTTLTVTSNISAVNFTGSQFTGNFSGNGATLTNLNAANISGIISNATFATTSGTSLTTNSVAGANVTGQVANALIAGTVTTRAQPNITSIGTLANLSVTGNVSSTYFVGSGTYLTGVFGPAFTAAQTAYQTLVRSDNLSYLDLVYNSLVSQNGTGYNPNTGVFTTVVAGWYSVSGSIAVCPYASHGDSGAGSIYIFKNNTPIVNGNFTGVFAIPAQTQTITVADTSTASTSVYLAVGDTLRCRIRYAASGDLWTTQSEGVSIFQAVWIRP